MTIKKIEIHAGHWSNPSSGANGILNEVTEARNVGKRVFEILQSWKVPATYFEDDVSTNQTQNINTLVKEHNKDRDGLVVSIHFNASAGTHSKPIGTEVLYYDQRGLAAKLSAAISKSTGGGLLDRGAKQRKDLGVLSSTYEPAILIEVCFVNSTIDAAIYRRDFEKICYSIAKELAEHIGKTVPGSTTIVQKETKTMLNETGRKEIRELLRKAKKRGIIDSSIHSDSKIDGYSDEQLLSYQAAIINRTFEQ